MKNSKLLTVLFAMQALTLAGQWLGSPSYVSLASAQVTDPGRDRLQILDELRSIDGKLDKLVEILGSGELQVKAVIPDENKGKTSGR